MIALNIREIPKFMSLFFSSETFDEKLVCNASIKTFVSYEIDGYTNKDFLDDTEEYEKYVKWKRLRPICRELIKGKKTPLSMKFTFTLSDDETARLLKAASYNGDTSLVHLYYNIVFEGAKLSILSATSTDTFLLDKTHDSIWDEALESSFKKLGIDYDKEI